MWRNIGMCGIVFALFVTTAVARQIENWSYERLFKEADIVVIASTKETVASDDRASDPRWKKNLVGQRTSFSVINTLKGEIDKDTLTVVHFKFKEGVLAQDGPLLVEFRKT